MKKPSIPKYQSIAYPLIAISLHLLPALMFYLFGRKLVSAPTILFTLMLSIGGILMGFISLGEGKDKIGIFGIILAIIAIVLPLGFMTYIGVFIFAALAGFYW